LPPSLAMDEFFWVIGFVFYKEMFSLATKYDYRIFLFSCLFWFSIKKIHNVFSFSINDHGHVVHPNLHIFSRLNLIEFL
jgi:hypothetical protein